MQVFVKCIIFIVVGFIAGAILGMFLGDPEDISGSVFGLWSWAGAAGSGLCALLYYTSDKYHGKKPKKEFDKGTTKSGEKVSQYYDAHWVSENDLTTNPNYMFTTYRNLPTIKKTGIVIRSLVKNGKLLINMYDELHTLVFGTTGTGKTTLIIDPAIRIFSHSAEKPCMVITDPKGELYKNHSIQLREEGYTLQVLDLRNPFASTCWNPMSNAYDLHKQANNLEKQVKVHNGGKPSQFNLKLTPDPIGQVWYEYNGYAYGSKEQLINDLKAKKQELNDTAENELREIAVNVVPIENKQEPGWERGAQDLLYGIMLAMLEDSDNPELGMTKDKFNFYNLASIATLRDDDPDNPYGTLRDYCGGRDKFSKVPSLVSTAINNAPTTTRSYMGILYTKISIFQDSGIRYCTSRSDMKFDDFVDKPTVLFIKVPDEKESRHCIATMCISQLYKKLIDIATPRPRQLLPRRVYFLLDEFANLPKIEKMDSMITVARSRNIFFELIIQSYSQLDTKYGQDIASIIRSNCNLQIYLGSDDQKTKEDFSKMCGEISLQIENESTSTSDKKEAGKQVTKSTQTVTRPLIGPYELGQIPRGTAIVKIFKNNPIRTELTPYYKCSDFDMRVAGDEYVPTKPFDERANFYDVKERNAKVYKKSNFNSFGF